MFELQSPSRPPPDDPTAASPARPPSSLHIPSLPSQLEMNPTGKHAVPLSGQARLTGLLSQFNPAFEALNIKLKWMQEIQTVHQQNILFSEAKINPCLTFR